MTAPPPPSFLVIGAQKCGTRWLRDNLGAHPEVFTADHEVEYFNHHFREGRSWYATHFAGWSGEPHVGEATPGYMFHLDGPELVAARVRIALGPDVALVAILRDPIERARSAYMHHLRRGRIPADVDPRRHLASLDPVTDPLGIVSGGWYGRSLDPFRRRFGDRLLVVFHDDVRRRPDAVVAEVLRHLGADDTWIPEEVAAVRNAGADQLGRRHPDHPILSLGADELREVIGHHFEHDTELLSAVLAGPPPWGRREVAA